VEGFGTCFNELGWTSLGYLPQVSRDSILHDLFAPGAGTNFSICRMPVGANDFARKWYSYNEIPGDFSMRSFSIANDFETLIPFIKGAQRYNPSLRIWASPWSPPSWMKYNEHYASRSVLGDSDFESEEWGMYLKGINNGLARDREGREGTDMFIQEEKYFRAYARYFGRFIDAYRRQGIRISMVMPQNEFNSAQVFPSCTWTAAGLSRFIAYLGPEMQKRGVEIYFGTLERGNEKLVDTILSSPLSKPYVKGAGFQWAGKDAIAGIHKRYPDLPLYQTEQECGNGKNDWKYCVYAWGLMKHYFSNGVRAYMYWNTSLPKGAVSTWGWKQNSLVSVDTARRSYQYNHEYYLIRHLSHFVRKGAQRIPLTGSFTDLLAFRNPDGSIVVMAYNDRPEVRSLCLRAGGQQLEAEAQPLSFNTWVLKPQTQPSNGK
jgi:glucosylceramidase